MTPVSLQSEIEIVLVVVLVLALSNSLRSSLVI
jgi:hypothetical protein